MVFVKRRKMGEGEAAKQKRSHFTPRKHYSGRQMLSKVLIGLILAPQLNPGIRFEKKSQRRLTSQHHLGCAYIVPNAAFAPYGCQLDSKLLKKILSGLEMQQHGRCSVQTARCCSLSNWTVPLLLSPPNFLCQKRIANHLLFF